MADALQIISAKNVKAETFYTGDEELSEIANKEDLRKSSESQVSDYKRRFETVKEMCEKFLRKRSMN